MIEWLVHRIFWWTRLRNAIFEEVHMYDHLKKVLDENDYKPEENSVFWCDDDGWKSKVFSISRNKYYFNDIPEENIIDAMRFAFELLGPEIDLAEEW